MVWHWADYVIMAIIGLSVLTGLFRGFVKEILSICVWAVAVWFGYNYTSNIADWLQPYIFDKSIRNGIAFVGIIITILVVGSIVNVMLSLILRHSGLRAPDRLLGMGFGLIRGIFIVTLMMVIIQMTSLPSRQYEQEGILYAKFNPLVRWLSNYVPDFINGFEQIEGEKIYSEKTLLGAKY